MKTLKVIAVVLLVVIVLGAGIYWMVYGMSNRGLEGFQMATTTTIPVIQKTIYLNTPKQITYQYIKDDADGLIACIASSVSMKRFPKFSIETGILSLDTINYLVENVHYIKVDKTELVYAVESAKNKKSEYGSEGDVLYASHAGKTVKVNDIDTRFIIPGDIICKTRTDIPNKIYLFNRDLFTNIQVRDSTQVAYIKDNIMDVSLDIGVSKQGLIRTIATNNRIDVTIWSYPANFTVNDNKLEAKKDKYKVSKYGDSYILDLQALFASFSENITTMNFIEKDTLNNIKQGVIEIKKQLNNKTAKLTEAEKAINSVLNESFNNYQSGFQDTQITSTTQGQTLSLADKIKKLNEAKAAAEAQAKKASNNAAKAIDEAKAAAEAQAKKASNNAAKTIDSAKAAANAQVKAAEETSAKLQSEIASAETKLGLLSQQLKMAVSQFQDVAALTTDKSLSDDLVSIETQIKDLTEAKKSAEGKLDDLRKLLQVAQFTTDPALLGSELANARSVLNNPPTQGACPQQKACPNISALDDTIRNLTNENASLGQKNDTKEAVIKDLDGKLDIANTTIDQLKDKIANFDKALTNEERELITNQKNDAVFAKQEIESKLKLTEYERDKAMKSRDEYRTKYETCADDLRNTFAGTATPVNAGTMMGGMPPSYVCKAMPANSGWVSPDRYPPFNPEMPAPGVAGRLATGGNFGGMVGTDMPGTQQGTEQQKQQAAASTTGIADTNLTAQTGFTDIPKQVINQQIQNTKSNPYWTYRPENYDSHDRYAAPSPWWVTGYNA